MNNIGKGVVAGSVMATIILFIGMCLFIAGFAVVHPTYMAIARNKMTSHIQDDKIYFEGRHFLGVGKEFITFPMAWQLIEFTDDDSTGETEYICKVDAPLDAATKKGLPMSVEVSVYFSIPPQQLINFYTKYGVHYEDSVANDCKSVLKNTLPLFDNDDVITNRLKVSAAMNDALNRSFAARYCRLEKVLLRGISFKTDMENSIEVTVLADQRATANEYSNQINMINAEIETLKKEYSYKVNLIISEAEKNATLIVEEARANANSIYATSTSEAWRTYQAATGLNTDNLLRVQWARALGATTASDTIALGYDAVGSKFVQKVTEA